MRRQEEERTPDRDEQQFAAFHANEENKGHLVAGLLVLHIFSVI